MLISDSHNFLFIHVPKTAGKSISAVLEPHCLPQNKTPLTRLMRFWPGRVAPGAMYFRHNDRPHYIAQKLGQQKFDSYRRFAVVRNPFDHAVSHYEYMKQLRRGGLGKIYAKMPFTQCLRLRADPPLPLRSLRARMKGLGYYFAHFPGQHVFMCDPHGKLLVPDILKFENLADDLRAYCKTLGIEVADLPVRNKSKFRSDRKNLNDYYTPESIDLVRRIYCDDFAAFGYSTDLLD